MVSRRTALKAATVALTGLAGCSGSPDQSTGTPTATKTEVNPAVETPPAGDCSAADPPKPETGSNLPAPRSYPEGPPTDADAVETFVGEYESAYKFNELLGAYKEEGTCVGKLHVFAEKITVRAAAEGYLVVVQVGGFRTTWDCDEQTPKPTPEDTPRTQHIGRAKYFLNERFLIRDGEPVECWS